MDVGFDVAWIELEGPLEMSQGALGLTQQREGKSEQVVSIGELLAAVDDVLQQVDGAVIILEREALPRLVDQRFVTDARKSPY